MMADRTRVLREQHQGSLTSWLTLPGDRQGSSLGNPLRPRRGRVFPPPYQSGDRSFIVLGPKSSTFRPTVAYGYVRGSRVELVDGTLSSEELESLRAFWRLS
jgi:hypothetical protein